MFIILLFNYYFFLMNFEFSFYFIKYHFASYFLKFMLFFHALFPIYNWPLLISFSSYQCLFKSTLLSLIFIILFHSYCYFIFKYFDFIFIINQNFALLLDFRYFSYFLKDQILKLLKNYINYQGVIAIMYFFISNFNLMTKNFNYYSFKPILFCLNIFYDFYLKRIFNLVKFTSKFHITDFFLFLIVYRYRHHNFNLNLKRLLHFLDFHLMCLIFLLFMKFFTFFIIIN